ncbi:hypothetical protein C2G38_2214237 [Gigaspora rosea]|uniref:Protein kinase domain-containing protein n=1 Tax=Gigaspora rosea TaxID=44941 RepID=A0A397UD09_9GLOM|nr:hypothetical protein C2G38_2214237 [Gigaspora rosea]
MEHTEGINCLGYCYEYRIGVEKNKIKAFIYYQKSANIVEIDKHKAFTIGIQKTAFCYYKFSVEEKINLMNRLKRYGLDKVIQWTIGNKDVDDCIKAFQLRAWKYEDVIEWIPFHRLSYVKEIGKGGFGSVYSATWLNSMREFKSPMEYKLYYTKLAIYGITQNVKTKDYLITFNLGLSRKVDEKVSAGEIYRVMPYVASEILLGDKPFTEKADIYGFGSSLDAVINLELRRGNKIGIKKDEKKAFEWYLKSAEWDLAQSDFVHLEAIVAILTVYKF